MLHLQEFRRQPLSALVLQVDTSRTPPVRHLSRSIPGATNQVRPSTQINMSITDLISPLACGKAGSGFTAAISQLAFGSAPGLGPGDACGRCFAVTASGDPYSPNYSGPFKTIVVKVTDLCPVQGNQDWCGQSRSNGVNRFGAPVQ